MPTFASHPIEDSVDICALLAESFWILWDTFHKSADWLRTNGWTPTFEIVDVGVFHAILAIGIDIINHVSPFTRIDDRPQVSHYIEVT